MMVDCGEQTGLHIEVFGPETHLTSVVSYALGLKAAPTSDTDYDPHFSIKNENTMHRSGSGGNLAKLGQSRSSDQLPDLEVAAAKPEYTLFTHQTESVIYGMQPKAVQNMLV